MPSNDEPFEQFEDIFEEWVDGIKSITEVQGEINYRFHLQGYRMLATLDSNYPETTGTHVDEVYRSIMQALDEWGTVVWYQIENVAHKDDGNATFGSLRLKRRPSGLVDEDIHIAKYFDGEYDFNEHILTDDPYHWNYADLGVGFGDSRPDMKYIGLQVKPIEVINDEGEAEWRDEISLPTGQSETTYTWFTNSVYIPQPYNIQFTPYINETIRKAIRKAKL